MLVTLYEQEKVVGSGESMKKCHKKELIYNNFFITSYFNLFLFLFFFSFLTVCIFADVKTKSKLNFQFVRGFKI